MTIEQIRNRLAELEIDRLDLIANNPINDILDILAQTSFEKFSLQLKLKKQIDNPPPIPTFPESWE